MIGIIRFLALRLALGVLVLWLITMAVVTQAPQGSSADEDAERMTGRIGEDVQRFFLVVGAIEP
jgi:hypothetical protein